MEFLVHKEVAAASEGNKVDQLKRKVKSLYGSIHKISRNIEKLRTRESVHYECKLSFKIIVIKSSNKSVIMWNILKIVAFVIVVCIEIYMVTSFFNKQEKRREGFRSASRL